MKVANILRVPNAPFKRQGKDFDNLFVKPMAKKKAWDGQDKDAFFRDKYAHVHAKQRKIRDEEQAAKRARTPKSKTAEPVSRAPRLDNNFAEKLKKQLEKDSRLEHVFGTSPVLNALETRKALKLYTANKYPDIDLRILRKCSELDIPVVANTPLQHMTILTSNGVHNKYALAVHKREIPSVSDFEIKGSTLVAGDEQIPILRKNPLVLFIDQVTDTHNMGAILRSAYWLGADCVIYSGRNCAPYSPQVVKASAGAGEHVPILQAAQPLKLFETLATKGWDIISAAPPSSKANLKAIAPEQLNKALEDKPCMLVIGSEGDGVRTSLLQRSTKRVGLTGTRTNPNVDSLNVSVATALLLNSFGAPKGTETEAASAPVPETKAEPETD